MRRSPATRPLLYLAGLFLLTTLPLIDGVVHYHGDEQYYTDAAIQMVQTGDWWTPRWEDGTPRFNKPILPYWLTAVGFRLLGIRYAGARLFFLLAGLATIWVTYRLARVLFTDRTTALVAAAIIASSLEARAAALRAMPDILISLFLGLSILGFARLFQRDHPRPADARLGWAGAGLAMASKGLLGIVVITFVLLFGALAVRRRGIMRQLLAPGAVAIGLALGLFWYAGILIIHGTSGLALFFHDQVGTRVGASALVIGENAIRSMLTTIRGFLPWSAMALVGLFAGRRNILAALAPHRLSIQLILWWSLLLALIFAAPIHSISRYFLPAHALLSCLTAAWLTALARQPEIPRLFARARIPILATLAGLGILVASIGWKLDARISLWGGILTAASLGVALFTQQRSAPRLFYALATWLLIVAGAYDIFVRPVMSVSPAPTMTQELLKLGAAHQQVQTLDVAARQIGQIRVLSGGKLWPKPFPTQNAGTFPAPYALARDTSCPLLDHQYETHPCGFRYKKVRVSTAMEILKKGRDAVLPGLRIGYCVGVRR